VPHDGLRTCPALRARRRARERRPRRVVWPSCAFKNSASMQLVALTFAVWSLAAPSEGAMLQALGQGAFSVGCVPPGLPRALPGAARAACLHNMPGRAHQMRAQRTPVCALSHRGAHCRVRTPASQRASEPAGANGADARECPHAWQLCAVQNAAGQDHARQDVRRLRGAASALVSRNYSVLPCCALPLICWLPSIIRACTPAHPLQIMVPLVPGYHISIVPILYDNYSYLIVDEASRTCVACLRASFPLSPLPPSCPDALLLAVHVALPELYAG
jgi:hypothetical protein